MDASDSPSIAVTAGEPRVGSGDLFYKSRDFLAYIALGIAVLAFHGYITSAGTANVLLQTLPIWMLPGLILAFFAAGIAGDRHLAARKAGRPSIGYPMTVWSRHLLVRDSAGNGRMRYGPGSTRERHNDSGGPNIVKRA